MKICFLDKTSFYYDIDDLNSPHLRGAETVLLNLAKSLSKFGHEVFIINNCPKNQIIQDINFININKLDNKIDFELAISNNDCTLFNFINSNKRILISHSVQTIEKFIRKKQLIDYVKYKPKVALLGEYHLKVRSYLTRMFGYFILPYAVDDIFLKTLINKSDNTVNKNQAIFTSRSDRNLDLLIDIWCNQIFSKYKKYKLLVTPIKNNNLSKFSIYNRLLGDRQNLINDLLKSRMLLVPGHKAELYCLAAEEARELCVPIVTMGIGCLYERVDHEKTGYVAKSKKEFADFVIELFNDDTIWSEFRSNLLQLRSSKNWIKSAKILIDNI